MSYAQAAASGPKQSPEEVRGVSAASFHISSPGHDNPPMASLSFSNILSLSLTIPFSRAPEPPQLEQHSSEASSLIDVDSPHVSSVPSDYDTQSVKTDTQAERLEHEAEDKAREYESRAKSAAFDAKKKATTEAKKAKEKAREAGEEFKENKDNPVVIGNAVVIAVGAAALGFGAYHKHAKGELTWKVVGLWTGIVGGLAVGDYYLSQWLFKNKYPKK